MLGFISVKLSFVANCSACKQVENMASRTFWAFVFLNLFYPSIFVLTHSFIAFEISYGRNREVIVHSPTQELNKSDCSLEVGV